MATRAYGTSRRPHEPESVDRVLDAAERLMREDAFHTATMEQLAAAAGVSRATVFNRFGTKLGVLQALYGRCVTSPEMSAVTDALAIDDPLRALDEVIDTACAMWEAHGFVQEQLQAIVVLEPGVSALVDEQRDEQRRDLEALTRRLARADLLRPGLGEARVTATLHMLTSLETFVWLRREHGLSLRQTRTTITDLAHTQLR